jgi:hypothetical protein
MGTSMSPSLLAFAKILRGVSLLAHHIHNTGLSHMTTFLHNKKAVRVKKMWRQLLVRVSK